MGTTNTKERIAGVLAKKDFAQRLKTSNGTFKCHTFVINIFFPSMSPTEIERLFAGVSSSAAKIIYSYLSYGDVELAKLEQVPVMALFEVWQFSRDLKVHKMEVWIRFKIRSMINTNCVLDYGLCSIKTGLYDELGAILKVIKDKSQLFHEKLVQYPELAAFIATINLSDYPIEKLQVVPNEENILLKLWSQKIGTDLKLIVENEEIPVHKAILSAESEYWRNQFIFKNIDQLVHEPPFPLETFKVILQYLYIGVLETTKPMDLVYLLVYQNYYSISTYDNINQYCLKILKRPTNEMLQTIKTTIKNDHFPVATLQKIQSFIDQNPDTANLFPTAFIEQKLQHVGAFNDFTALMTTKVSALEAENNLLKNNIRSLEERLSRTEEHLAKLMKQNL